MSEETPQQLSFPEASEHPADRVVDPALVPVIEPDGQKGLPSRVQARAGLTEEQIALLEGRNAPGIAEAKAALDRINQRKPR